MNIAVKMPLVTLATCAVLHTAPWLAPQLTPIEMRRAFIMVFWGLRLVGMGAGSQARLDSRR